MTHITSRREFVKAAAVGASVLTVAARGNANAAPKNVLPRWRGFNLPGRMADIPEDDFRMIRDFGFDWVRIPMNYWLLTDSDAVKAGKMELKDVTRVKESALADVDRIVELGRKYSIHVNLALHRAPGYCISDRDPNMGREPFDLWKDAAASDAFTFYWDLFARRYKGVKPAELSFNLLNEPYSPIPGPPNRSDLLNQGVRVHGRLGSWRRGPITSEPHRRVMMRVIDKIRETSPDRIILIDGLCVGNEVVTDMIPTGVAQSVHGYYPLEVSHYRTGHVDPVGDFPPNPQWPGAKKLFGPGTYDRTSLEEFYAPWGDLVKIGIGVHGGEAGGWIKTPHDTFLRWMCDVLDIWKGYNIGWGLWNFRGAFGVMDSGREDVVYEDYKGHKLDRKLMDLLQLH
jgi:endoglucanase